MMTIPQQLQRFQLLNYTKANGEELVGLAVELTEDANSGIQVQILMDSNVISRTYVAASHPKARTSSAVGNG